MELISYEHLGIEHIIAIGKGADGAHCCAVYVRHAYADHLERDFPQLLTVAEVSRRKLKRPMEPDAIADEHLYVRCPASNDLKPVSLKKRMQG